MKRVKKEFLLEGLDCANCASKIEDRIGKLNGVLAVSMNFTTKTLAIEVEDHERLDNVLLQAREIINRLEPHVIITEKVISKHEKKVFLLMGLGCANCAAKIEHEVKNLTGVAAATVDFVNKKLIIEPVKMEDLSRILQEAEGIVRRIEPDVKIVAEKNKNDKAENTMDKEAEAGDKAEWIRLGVGLAIFALAGILNMNFWLELGLYLVSYLLIGGEVLVKSINNIRNGEVFDENFLMSVATVGAFAIGEFPEGVAVMLFYQIGEFFQDKAVDHSRRSIRALMDIRPDFANLKLGENTERVSPEAVRVDDYILVRPGEKIPLDGIVTDGSSMLDTSALTGESLPREVEAGDAVLAGSINTNGVLTVQVTREFGESTVSKILDLVQNAAGKKAPTENFITKFARYYTPAVVFIAMALAVLPPLMIPGESFSKWIYRALIFLVVSCPCALVISIPLSFFGGIGGASRNGILIKGSNYLEALNSVDTVVFDKTGTLTKGVFNVTEIIPTAGISQEALLEYAALGESYSNHPIAVSILKAYGKAADRNEISEYQEISGYGTQVRVNGKEILAGNGKLMDREGVAFSSDNQLGTVVHIAVDKAYAGCIVISDEIKQDAHQAIKELKQMGVRRTVMLTGDTRAVGEAVARKLGLDGVFTDLLPHQKVERLEQLEKEKTKGKLVFVGDGINDAPVLARADIGIAMGGLGSDAAIEAADIVIMTDEPSKIAASIRIAKQTRSIVWQNILFAFGVKLIVLILGAGGIATMWEAVFADVGVALVAVLNAMRVLQVRDI